MNDTPSSPAANLDAAREVRPGPITGKERPDQLLASAFPAFVGRQVRTAFELMARSIESDHAIFLTLSGAMTPAGLHRSCIVPMVQAGMIDVLTTTGANLYHDAHRVIGHRIAEIRPDAGDTALREARIIRIYDLGFDERVLLETDQLFAQLLRRPEMQKAMTTAELHHHLGRQLAALEDALGVDQPCLLSACYRHAVPIFVGAPQDGSIFLNVVKLKALLGDDFGFSLDVAQDVFDMAAVQWMAQRAGNTSVFILGGGVPKNYTLQGEPTLSQIFELDARGFDVDVQNWRMIAGAPGLSDEQRDALISTIRTMAESDAWNKELETKGWVNTYLDGPDFAEYLKGEIEQTGAILGELGITQ